MSIEATEIEQTIITYFNYHNDQLFQNVVQGAGSFLKDDILDYEMIKIGYQWNPFKKVWVKL